MSDYFRICNLNISEITLQVCNKNSFFNINWESLFLPNNLCKISKFELYCTGVFYGHHINQIKIPIPAHDSELCTLKKAILSEINRNNFIMLDISTKKIETLSIDFLMQKENTKLLLENFTHLQSFFLGFRTGIIHDSKTFELQ